MRAPEELTEAIRASGLIPAGSRGVVMVSGGADSACLVAGLAALLGPDQIDALHLNYRLRPDSDEDEAICRDLCGRLLVSLRVERPTLPAGNVQAAAREARYAAAERLRAQSGAAWIATGHNRTDLAETMIYRLATSPGRRALLGMAPRRGRIVRPLLAIGRDRLRELAAQAGLPYKDDPSNLDPRYARVRVRHDVLPVLRELSPEYERNIAGTWRELAQESEALEAIAAAAIDSAQPGAVQVSSLESLHPALRRIALRQLAESVSGRQIPLGIAKAAEIWRIATRPQGGVVDLTAGVRAICEAGWIVLAADRAPAVVPTGAVGAVARAAADAGAMVADPGAAPAGGASTPTPAPEAATVADDAAPGWEPAILPVPGGCRWGRWQLRAEVQEGRPSRPLGPDVAMLDADLVEEQLTVRAWQEGDRIRPLGLEGSKSLQDLFTDRGVPRSHRRLLPVLVSGDHIAWVAGLAIGEEFKLSARTRRTLVVSADPVRR